MAIKVIPDDEIPDDALMVVCRVPEGGTIPAFDDKLGLGQNVACTCSRCGAACYERPYNPKQLKRVCIPCMADMIEAEGQKDAADKIRHIDTEDHGR